MEEDEVWVTDERINGNGNSFSSDHPSSFILDLNLQGQPGGYHVRNKPGEKQRKAVSVFRGSSIWGKSPAFTVSCNAKAIVHGMMNSTSNKKATLLAYDFKFNSYRQTRIKEADIRFEFLSSNGKQDGGCPLVTEVRPQRKHYVWETTEKMTSKMAFDLEAGPEIPAVNVGMKLSKEKEVEKTTTHYTIITGDRPQDDWGNFFEARFTLSENDSQKTGIPSEFSVCILLERETDDDFMCVPYIEVRPDFSTMVASLITSRTRDDPVIFDVQEEPFNTLTKPVAIDPNNLEATDMDKLWGYTR